MCKVLYGITTLPGQSVPGPTDPGPSLPAPSVHGPLKLAECNQNWKKQELTVQEVSCSRPKHGKLTCFQGFYSLGLFSHRGQEGPLAP